MTASHPARSVALVLCLIGLLSGCNDSPSADEASAAFEECTIYRNGASVSVSVTGFGAVAACDEMIQKWSDASGFWTYEGTPDPSATLVCELETPEDGGLVAVRDTSGQLYGSEICGTLIGSGWRQVG